MRYEGEHILIGQIGRDTEGLFGCSVKWGSACLRRVCNDIGYELVEVIDPNSAAAVQQ